MGPDASEHEPRSAEETTCDQAAAILQDATGPIPAIALAGRLGFVGDRETKRRKVRRVILRIRLWGHRVCASLANGYWLARNDTEWREYREAVTRKLCFRFKDLNDQKRAAAERVTRQGRLFG